MKNIEGQRFLTSDLHLTTALTASGFKFSSTDRVGQKIVFGFDDQSGQVGLFVDKYWLSQVSVDPLAYSTNLKYLLGLIHQQREPL